MEVIANWFKRLLPQRTHQVSYYTIDGNNLAPYPGMTDEELYTFESEFDVPNPTFKSLEDYWELTKHHTVRS